MAPWVCKEAFGALGSRQTTFKPTSGKTERLTQPEAYELTSVSYKPS